MYENEVSSRLHIITTKSGPPGPHWVQNVNIAIEICVNVFNMCKLPSQDPLNPTAKPHIETDAAASLPQMSIFY